LVTSAVYCLYLCVLWAMVSESMLGPMLVYHFVKIVCVCYSSSDRLFDCPSVCLSHTWTLSKSWISTSLNFVTT